MNTWIWTAAILIGMQGVGKLLCVLGNKGPKFSPAVYVVQALFRFAMLIWLAAVWQ